LSKQAQVLRASTASADGTTIKMQTNKPATSIMRKFLQSLRETSILLIPNSITYKHSIIEVALPFFLFF
jgi:hypothetical protein